MDDKVKYFIMVFLQVFYLLMINIIFLFLMFIFPRKALIMFVVMILVDIVLSIFLIKFLKYYNQDE